MKYLLICLSTALASVVQCQDYVQQAKNFQQQYKDDKAIVLQSNDVYEFARESKGRVKVSVSSAKKMLSLRYNETIFETEWYNQNLQIDKFQASSSLKQKLPNELKLCASYTSEGLFYDDSGFCSHSLKLKELGEVWDVTAAKRINDAKYLTTLYFQHDYPAMDRKIRFVIPSGIEVEIKEFNLAEATIVKDEKIINGATIIEYHATNLAAHKKENLDRGDQFTRPHLLILVKSVMEDGKKTAILSAPEDLYNWYSSLTQQLKPNPQNYKATVAQLIQNKKTDEDKVKEIFYWVQDNIRYIAFEDGIAGFKPSEAQDVFDKRYGDCKGMANLTKEMLKVAGYDARLTWIGTRRIMYDHSLPSLAVNNHMICTLFLNGNTYFLDATEKYAPFGQNAARILGKSVMIEDGKKFIVGKIANSENSTDSDVRTVKAAIDGDNLTGTFNIELKGEVKKNFLYSYNYTKSEERANYVSDFLASNNNNLKTKGIILPSLEERSGPLSITCDMRFTGAVSSFNNEYYIDIDPSKQLKDWEIKETRQNDVDFGERYNKVTSIELAIPSGYLVSYLPEPLAISSAEFSFKMEYQLVSDKIIYAKTLTIPSGIVTRKSFPMWNDAVKKLSKGYQTQVVLKRKS